MRVRDAEYDVQDAQAGRNVIECLLRYLDKGGYWTDNASLKQVAIGIMRKVSACPQHTCMLLACSCSSATLFTHVCVSAAHRGCKAGHSEERNVCSSVVKGWLMAQAAMPGSLLACASNWF